MIKKETLLSVADNSGARQVLCIGVLGSIKHTATLGDVVVVSVKVAIPNSKVKSGQVYRAVVVRVRKSCRRKDNTRIAFSDNAVVLINTQSEMIGTRVFGPVAQELRKKGYMKLISLATEVL
ncbi:MAG: ribosomal protein L14 [Candidatus Xenolissoclinum pacificiensis L6]|uniref:Large ribosomal subunit protein uL14 n=1 Tax=Candidatus Xenolissoclinum pacificiensis L6 TaxID=1401685 RepID=W2UZP0_9RICK|nr:MAG: ribosomal protein L14 [Candidatus Xenolissoclinum pacificiensis L6]